MKISDFIPTLYIFVNKLEALSSTYVLFFNCVGYIIILLNILMRLLKFNLCSSLFKTIFKVIRNVLCLPCSPPSYFLFYLFRLRTFHESNLFHTLMVLHYALPHINAGYWLSIYTREKHRGMKYYFIYFYWH